MFQFADLAKSYEDQTRSSIRLIPTEGVMSPYQRSMYEYIHTDRYLHAPIEDSLKAIKYPDIGKLQEIHDLTRSYLKEIFQCNHINIDMISGMQCMSITILAFSEVGEEVYTISSEEGGHESTEIMIKKLGRVYKALNFFDLQYSHNNSTQPSQFSGLVYLDQSNIIHEWNLKKIRDQFPKATIVVDISQVMIFVAAQIFVNPIHNYADFVIGSTHKSMNGPQKAIGYCNDSSLFKIFCDYARVFVSNNHPASVAALGACAEEFRVFGNEFASQMQDNARALAAGLHNNGIQIHDKHFYNSNSFTDTQHVWIDCEVNGYNANAAVQKLSSSGIVVNTLFLPRNNFDKKSNRGLRLGSTEVTRYGMKENEMFIISDMISELLLGEKNIDRIELQIKNLSNSFGSVRYCFNI